MEHPYSGSWGYQVTGLLRADRALRRSRRLPRVRRRAAPAGDRRDPRLGARALPARRLGARALRRHGALRARGPAPRRASGLGDARLQLRAQRGAELPALERALLAEGVPRRRPARRRRRVDALPRLLAQGGRVGAERVRRPRGPRRGRVPAADERGRARTRGRASISAAEESTAWPGVSRPVYLGGLGFGFKWNMGWMHDTLDYFAHESIHRRYHHHQLTFSLVYAFSENFILPLSHDEVVHGKGSLVDKMPGDRWQKLANLRALYGYMWAHPGKKLVFMGGELAQWREWNAESSLDWHLLEDRDHQGVQSLVRDLNARVPRHAGAVGGRLRADGLPLARAERRGRERPRVHAHRHGRAAAARLRLQLLAGAALRLPARPAARAASWREVVNTDAGALRRLRRRQPRPRWRPRRRRGTTSRSRPR